MSDTEHQETGAPAHHPDAKDRAFFADGYKGRIFDDKELVDGFKKRPKSRRNPIVMAAVALMSLYLMWDMRADLVFFLGSPSPRILGTAEELVAANLKSNTYVILRGYPDPRKAQIELTNFGVMSKSYLYFMYLGNTSIIAREEIRELDKMTASKDEYDTKPRAGRLYAFTDFPHKAELGRVRDYFRSRFERGFGESSWVLIIGEKPWSDIHIPLLYLVLIGFVAFNGWQLYRRYFERS